jgi:hypothetical protein
MILPMYLRNYHRLPIVSIMDNLPINSILIRVVNKYETKYHYYISNSLIYRKTSNGYDCYISKMELVND